MSKAWTKNCSGSTEFCKKFFHISKVHKMNLTERRWVLHILETDDNFIFFSTFDRIIYTRPILPFLTWYIMWARVPNNTSDRIIIFSNVIQPTNQYLFKISIDLIKTLYQRAKSKLKRLNQAARL